MPDQAQLLTAEAVLAREAVYRAIGEGFFRPAVAAQVNFPAWYTSELADLLQVGAAVLVHLLPALEAGDVSNVELCPADVIILSSPGKGNVLHQMKLLGWSASTGIFL